MYRVLKPGGREGQRLGIELGVDHIVGDALVDQTITADSEHGGIDVRQHDLAALADQGGKANGEVAGAARQIQHAVARSHAAQLDGETLDQTMRAQGHQVVHHVVLAGDGVEHLADALDLLFHRHLLVAEMRGAGLVLVGVGHGGFLLTVAVWMGK